MPARGQKIDHEVVRRAGAMLVAGELSVGALAERFGISPGSVKGAAHRLRKASGMSVPRRGGLPADPTSLQHELGERARQAGFLTCCQSPGHHRFDCPAVPPDRRGHPYLPVAPMSARQLVDRLRGERGA